MSEDLQIHYRAAAIGEDAREFLASDLGKFVMQRAESEIEELTRSLIETNADNTTEVRRLQTEIQRRDMAIKWFVEAYEAGRQALQILEDQHE